MAGFSGIATVALGIAMVAALAGCSSSPPAKALSASTVSQAAASQALASQAAASQALASQALASQASVSQLPGQSSAAASQAQTTSGDDCGGAVARVTTAVASFAAVTKVHTIAACHEVDIVTNLPGGVLGSPSATTGAAICDAAAKVAYQGDVSSITVTAVDGHEIAAGLKDMSCIPG
jgi:hypothetical protein